MPLDGVEDGLSDARGRGVGKRARIQRQRPFEPGLVERLTGRIFGFGDAVAVHHQRIARLEARRARLVASILRTSPARCRRSSAARSYHFAAGAGEVSARR